MATNETMHSPEPCNVNPVRLDHVQNVSSRRLKKREVDRRCQRETRERKRSHVAYLEKLVETLRQQDASERVTALLQQLKKTEEERDMATKKLRDIQKIMGQGSLELEKRQTRDTGSVTAEVISEEITSINEFTAGTKAAYNPVPVEYHPTFLDIELARSISPHNVEHDQYNMPTDPEVVRHDSPSLTDRTIAHFEAKSRPQVMVSSQIYNWVDPQLGCSCHAHVDRQPGEPAVWQGNFWKFVSEILDERFDWTEDIQPANDVDSEDVPIRAMVQGWDAVAERGPLHPSLQMLRRIDEATFQPIPKTERLAMLRAMHLLLQFHTEPTTERYGRLPPWYLYRPSHSIVHTYAIDYYAWPQFRQRFILNQHAYCGNDFWRMYQDQMRILWPFEFRDCYTLDLETGLYKSSRMFDERINDINCWTMGPDFFRRFPELSSDIPGNIHRIPKALPSATREAEEQSLPSRYAASVERVPLTSQTVAEGEELFQEEQMEQRQNEWANLHVLSSQIFAKTNPRSHIRSQNMQSSALTQELPSYFFEQVASGPSLYFSTTV
ncbi:Nn.00g016500.m01.CDS01 [Neocucurbitaria sp. VM-36]